MSLPLFFLHSWTLMLVHIVCLAFGSGAVANEPDMAFIEKQIGANADKTGVYVLDTANEALIARAWLVDNAKKSIEVQYFIWSTDNIGILAAEALLRAASRGVHVRVIVDDLLIDAPDKSLLALAHHPQVEIRIYNPQTSVGIPLQKRLLNVVSNFRGVNQRMHDKTFIVDGKIAVIGGRNMAAEYYDYNQKYNFRDRDVLLLGGAVADLRASFERFWSSELSAKVENLYDGLGLMKKNVRVDDAEIKKIYTDLHDYAKSPDNFSPEVRQAIVSTPQSFERLSKEVTWCTVEVISDRPGKNETRMGLGGGGETAQRLADLVERARNTITIQSPYLVLSDAAIALFQRATTRGVKVAISTNSMASTDNLPAFSGYRNQRDRLALMGVRVFEYRPDAVAPRTAMRRSPTVAGSPPIFSMHAKTLVVDSRVVFIGTFNLDPRSENLNTEVGVLIHDAATARAVEAAIKLDMSVGNSWSADSADPDQYAPFGKRAKVRLLQLVPIRPLL